MEFTMKLKKYSFRSFALLNALALSSSLCASYLVETIDSDYLGYGGRYGYTGSIDLNGPRDVAVDNVGNLFVAVYGDNAAIKLEPLNSLTYLPNMISIDVPEANGIAVDTSGNVYASSKSGNDIVKIQSGSYDFSTVAEGLSSPSRMCFDSTGTLFVVDTGNNTIKKITSTGVISTISVAFAVTGEQFSSPTGITIDSSGNLYVADTGNGSIRKLAPSTLSAGAYTASTITIPGTSFSQPTGITIDSSGNLFVTDTGTNLIRKLAKSADGSYAVSTIAGTGTSGFANGSGTAASFNQPSGIAVDSSGNLYVADYGNHVIRKLFANAANLTIDVESGSASVTAPIAATIVYKAGAGTAVFSGNADNSEVSMLQINAGLVQVSATKHMGNAITFAGGNMEVTSGIVAIPAATVNVAAKITTDAGAAVSSVEAPSGSSLLTFAGSGVVTAGDMHTSLTPVSIPGIMHVGAVSSSVPSRSSKLTAGVITVPSNGLLEIMAATAASVPGITEVQSGGILQVAASVHVPANSSSHGDIFNNGSTGGSLKFDTGAKLKLGDGSSWARNITVGAAL
jgi:sugar lactone lactonase YvrE